MKSKRGQMSIMIVFLILALLLFSILIFTGGVIVVRINTALSQDIDIGNVNLKNVTEDTFGQFETMFLNNADWWGLCVIFGTILGIFLSSYVLRGRIPKWAIIIDIFIIITMFIISLYVSSSYNVMVNALGDAGETFLEVYTPYTSSFILNLPIFVVIIGVISMVLFHSSIPRKTEQAYQSGGYLQGAY